MGTIFGYVRKSKPATGWRSRDDRDRRAWNDRRWRPDVLQARQALLNIKYHVESAGFASPT